MLLISDDRWRYGLLAGPVCNLSLLLTLMHPFEVQADLLENKDDTPVSEAVESPVLAESEPPQSLESQKLLLAPVERNPYELPTLVPVINLQELQWRPLPLSNSADELRGTTNEAFTLEDYLPEPENTPFFEVDAEVATAQPDFVQWRATLWGGVMTDNDLIESMTGQGVVLEDSNFLGLGVSRTLAGGNTIKLEGELQLLQHLGLQDHLEGTAALALRYEMSPSFSVALIEGVSYATALPEIENDNNTRESHFLNYLAFEVEYSYTPQWAIAGRLHHRSGAGGIFGNAIGGSNAYLMGIRHRF